MIRIAVPEDIQKISGMVEEFIKESGWGWTYNEEKTQTSLFNYMGNEETIVLLSPNGFAILAFDEDFHDERIGYIQKFYISKSGRKTQEGRELTAASCGWFDFHKCIKSFATDTAFIQQGKAFVNLMSKFGFKECGQTLVRGKNEQN
jgi:hypothetical protein